MSYNFRSLESNLRKISPETLSSFTWGIEREAHRILSDGTLSRERHPELLAPPSFTMDFAESQLELVTRPLPSIGDVVDELDALTRKASHGVGEDLLWPFSMPPLLPPDGQIRLAAPGSGEAARSAERYRNGLALRYGVSRQMICGVHVNVSMRPCLLAALEDAAPLSAEEAKERTVADAYYLRLVRNLVDDLGPLVFFFGASPVREDVAAAAGPLISYRNSPLGYARSEYRPFFDLTSIAAHVGGIRRGLRTESEAFRRIGLVREGRAIQLNGRVFQKEKEFYAPIRFRSIPKRGETPLTALERRGVEYLELRFFDVDPFSPSGVSSDALKLLHLLLLDGLSRASTPRTNAEWVNRLAFADEAALSDPFALPMDAPLLRSAALRLESLEPIAAVLDAAVLNAAAWVAGAGAGSATHGPGAGYAETLERYRKGAADPRLSASARLYAAYRSSGTSWTAFGARVAREVRAGFSRALYANQNAKGRNDGNGRLELGRKRGPRAVHATGH